VTDNVTKLHPHSAASYTPLELIEDKEVREMFEKSKTAILICADDDGHYWHSKCGNERVSSFIGLMEMVKDSLIRDALDE